MARGLAQAGDFAAALDHEIRLIDDESLAKTLVSVGESTRVQPAAVVGPDLGELYRKAPDAQKAANSQENRTMGGRSGRRRQD